MHAEMPQTPDIDFAALVEDLDVSVSVFDHETRLVYTNKASARALGRPRDALYGLRPWEMVQSESAEPGAYRRALESVVAGGPRTQVTAFVPGIARWYEFDVARHARGAVVVARDVTEAREALETLTRSEQRFRAMVEYAPEAIVIMNATTGMYVDVNDEAERVFGRTRAELLTLGPGQLSPPMQPGGVPTRVASRALVERLMRGESVVTEWLALGPNNEPILIEIHGRILPGSADPILVRSSVFDITARKRSQEQLAKVQRLEAVARLAGGVAHDFNNMLTVIMGGLQLALSGPEQAREDLEDALLAAERAANITRQLLAFGRSQKSAPRLLDLSDHIEGLRSVLQRLLGEDIDLVLEMARPLGGALIDPAQLEQVVLNLVANARDAMPRGGRLSLHTANVLVDAVNEKEHNGVPPGRYVVLTVTDTGEGIPEAATQYIFEPFFTTRGLERGTGLGLSTVHGIVKQNDGHIWVSSEVGRGTTFKVYLPRVEAASPGEASPRTERATKARGGSETILLVEDEGTVRAFLRRALQRGGYTVLEACNAGEALLICEQHVGSLPLMVTDVIMPRMTGPQLADRLRALHPRLKVIYVSGYNEDRLEPPRNPDVHDGFLAKPVTVDALLECVRTALDR